MNAQSRSLRKLASLGAMAIVATTLFAGSHPASAQDATPAAGASTATVSVSGVGTATVVPDTASVQLGVTVTEDTLTAAQASASTQMEAIIDSVKAAGIEDKDIQTSTYYVSVVQNYDSNGNPSEVTSFQVQNQVNVVIRDISKVGDVLDGAVAAGANTIYGVNFYVDDSTAGRQPGTQARRPGCAPARARARRSSWHDPGSRCFDYRGVQLRTGLWHAAAPAWPLTAAPSTPIQAGTSTVEVDVTVVYQLI